MPVSVNNVHADENGYTTEYAHGYKEEKIDKDGLLHKKVVLKGDIEIPSSYSLVDDGFVTPVKNQNPYGTCWTFATAGSAESGLKKKYGLEVDLAELQLAYYVYNSLNKADPMNIIVNDGNIAIDPNIFDVGGNTVDTTLALANGIGFTDETDYPYSEASSYESNGTTKECYNSSYRLRAARWMNMSEPERIK